MKKYMGLGLIVLVIVLIAYRIITHGEETTIKSIDTYQQENGIPVEVQEVKRSDLIISRSFSGTIEGRDQADANTQTAQEVVSIPVQVGQFVKKGEVVARLDPDIGSNATLRYNQAKANYEDAKKDFERMKSLHEAGAISQQEFDKVELRYDIAQQDFQAARKIVHIVSPINGVVTHIYRKVGETVPMGKPVVRVARLDEVLIKLNIDETQIAGVQNGQEAIVTVAAYPNKEFTGYLENLSLSADPDSRTFQAWVRVDNEEFLLRPGMFAEVELLITTEENVLIVSKDALIEKDNASMVYVVTDQNVARAQEVSIGGNSGTQVRVVSGVLENDRVVVLGHNKLEDGKKVHIVSDTLVTKNQ